MGMSVFYYRYYRPSRTMVYGHLVLNNFDRAIFIFFRLPFVAALQRGGPYARIGLIIVVYSVLLSIIFSFHFLLISQYGCFVVDAIFFVMCFMRQSHVNLLSSIIPKYFVSVVRGTIVWFINTAFCSCRFNAKQIFRLLCGLIVIFFCIIHQCSSSSLRVKCPVVVESSANISIKFLISLGGFAGVEQVL